MKILHEFYKEYIIEKLHAYTHTQSERECALAQEWTFCHLVLRPLGKLEGDLAW